MPLTHRYYLADAKFLVALGGERAFLEEIDQALRCPCWPLYLGRRSCPPDLPLTLGVHDEYADVREALSREPWLASAWLKGRRGDDSAEELVVVCDAREGEPAEYHPDCPLSFAAAGRVYADRPVYRFSVPNPSWQRPAVEPAQACASPCDHDPMSCL